MVSLHAAFAVMALSAGGQTVLLDFYADWCAPCRAMESTVQELIAKGYPVRKVNIDQDRALAQQYGASNIPCYVMLVDGREVDRVEGGTTLYRLETACKKGLAQASAQPASPPAAQTPPRRAGPPDLGPPISAPPANQPARSGGPVSPDSTLMAASVRLRIEDAHGHSCGSGTIIDARNGEALILTCGHIFRESKGKGRIEVDLFGSGTPQRVPGKLVSYDPYRDVGLVSIRTSGPVTAARVAPPGYRVGQGEPVVSVGCNNGGAPTAVRSRITALDRYAGPPNLQVAGQPVEGRSGGGLFAADGLVIGVCNARDPSDQEGYYAAIPSIHAELDRAKLAFIYKGAEENAMVRAGAAPRGPLAPVEPPTMPGRIPASPASGLVGEVPARAAPASPGDAAPLSREEQAALEEIRRRLGDDAEVLCIVRSRRNPQAKSEVIMLDKASPEFLRQLAAEARSSQDPRRLTSLEVPRDRETKGDQGTAPSAGKAWPATPAARPFPPQQRPLRMEWSAGGQ